MNSNKIKIFLILIIAAIFAVFVILKKNAPSRQFGNSKQASLSSEQSQSFKNQLTSKACPAGFILVTGDPLYHTNDFCVMKYEAKCANASDPTIGLEPPRGDKCSGEAGGHYYDKYKNSGSGCACAGNRQIASTKSGFPIAYIPQYNTTPNNAKNYCAALGWHLITNNEWMTIARNVEKISANWCDRDGTNCGAAPGTQGKILANGHNDNKNETSVNGSGTDSALLAGDDNQPCLGTTTDGSNKCGGKDSQKRTLALGNGEIIWDFAGNVWEWIDDTVARKDEPRSATSGTRDSGWLKSDFAPGSLASVITDNGQGPSMGYDAFRPSNPTWNATNGVGRIYHYSSVADANTTVYAFIRGGNWKHGADDGAFTIHLSPPPSHSANDVGFRCVAPLQ
jgi:formylglycine-generating enzyme required for sulfatase activity